MYVNMLLSVCMSHVADQDLADQRQTLGRRTGPSNADFAYVTCLR